jgi:hypothetical protein
MAQVAHSSTTVPNYGWLSICVICCGRRKPSAQRHPGAAAGQVEAVVQEEADGVVGHMGIRPPVPCHAIRVSVTGDVFTLLDHARERIGAGLVDTKVSISVSRGPSGGDLDGV